MYNSFLIIYIIILQRCICLSLAANPQYLPVRNYIIISHVSYKKNIAEFYDCLVFKE